MLADVNAAEGSVPLWDTPMEVTIVSGVPAALPVPSTVTTLLDTALTGAPDAGAALALDPPPEPSA